jgi:ribosomal-protein-alanine N-acetyltransferase
MFFGKDDSIYKARTATSQDTEAIRRLTLGAWRVYLRFTPDELVLRLRSGLGWVAGQDDRLSGFMLAEIQPFLIAVITGAALKDTWRVASYLDTFLPAVEETLRSQEVTALVQIGQASWLTDLLRQRDFADKDRVITYEWHLQPVDVQGDRNVVVRSAHMHDLPTLLALDRTIFGPIWHKPMIHFEEALARAYTFTVAQEADQIVGYQWCERYERHGHLTRLAVRPDWEGRGIGTRLLTEALVAMVKSGVGWITLNTQESNLRSRILYERHGFRPIHERVAVLWKDL